MKAKAKILQIGNYPPPMCGWAIQTKLVTEELRRRGYVCEVLKINENREIKDAAYVDVQGGFDYLSKIVRYALRGYRLNVHVNGMSQKGYLLALAAGIVGRATFRPALITFHGGLSQDYFPRKDSLKLRLAFRWLFQLAGGIACDSPEIEAAIGDYGIDSRKVISIATFSAQYLDFTPQPLSAEINEFLGAHDPVFFSYVSFRPEYRLEVLRKGMALFREGGNSKAGFIWLGFPEKEMLSAREFVEGWPQQERQSLLLLGNLTHDEFLTLMTRCFACLRTPACDGVAASVLEALALGVPVIASKNGRRPAGVLTYEDEDPQDMFEKLCFVAENYGVTKATQPHSADDNVGKMADWLAGEALVPVSSEVVHAD